MPALLAQYQYRYPGHMDGSWDWSMGLFMIAVTVGAVALVIWLVLYARGNDRRETSAERLKRRETPADILDRRLASGEITPDEYRERSALIAGRGNER